MKAKEILQMMKDTTENKGELSFALKHKRTKGYLVNYDTGNFAGIFAYSNNKFYGIYGDFLEENFNYETNQIDSRFNSDIEILEILESILIDWDLVEAIDSDKKEFHFRPYKTKYEPQYVQDIAENKRIYISKQENEVIEFTVDGCKWNMKLEKFNGEKIRYKLDKAVKDYL
jgi:hypothetical protein